ncbi:hypothetical protein predicted by Glimmer/Critica [Lactiplantibacillus plantarum]|nr:hypothetical protein predicted by Glimmer/Critica [Lactiplantibacillus plantarum]
MIPKLTCYVADAPTRGHQQIIHGEPVTNSTT